MDFLKQVMYLAKDSKDFYSPVQRVLGKAFGHEGMVTSIGNAGKVPRTSWLNDVKELVGEDNLPPTAWLVTSADNKFVELVATEQEADELIATLEKE